MVHQREVEIIPEEEIEPRLNIISNTIPTQEIIGILALNTSSILKISNGMEITGSPQHMRSKIWCNKTGPRIRAIHLITKEIPKKAMPEGVLEGDRVKACMRTQLVKIMGGDVVKVMKPHMNP